MYFRISHTLIALRIDCLWKKFQLEYETCVNADARLYRDFYARWKLYRVAKSAFDHCAEIHVTEYPSTLGLKISEFTWIRARETAVQPSGSPTRYRTIVCRRERMYTRNCVLYEIYESNNVTICWYLRLLVSICIILIVKCYHSRAFSSQHSRVKSEYILPKNWKRDTFCIFISSYFKI